MKPNDWLEIDIANKDAGEQIGGFNTAFKLAAITIVGVFLYAGIPTAYTHIVTAFNGYFGG